MRSDTKPPFPPLADTDEMPFGKHKGKKMCNVDPEYLLHVFDQPWLSKWPRVEYYIDQNFDVLLQEQTEQRRKKKPYGT